MGGHFIPSPTQSTKRLQRYILTHYKMKLLILAFSILLTTVSCRQHETIFERMETRFKENEAALNNLVSILNDSTTNSFFSENKACIKAVDFNDAISQILNSLDLRKVCRHYGSCKNYNKIFIFETGWIPKDSVTIVHNICDTVQTKKGYYKKDENSNEVWGLGNSWQIIKIIKYLNHKQ